MIIVEESDKIVCNETPINNDQIHIFTQFFTSPNLIRNREIKYCLRKNVENPAIHQIHLLNERLYSNNELGIKSDKIVQHIINKRLKFSDIFSSPKKIGIEGYIVAINADIFFDGSIENLRRSNFSTGKNMACLIRYEYDGKSTATSPIYGLRGDSQDTWIYHSSQAPPEYTYPAFDFEFGKPGCDNKMAYLMMVAGYKVYNDPISIKSYHYHLSGQRNYSEKDIIKAPWGLIMPYGVPNRSMYLSSLGVHTQTALAEPCRFNDNRRLYHIILSKGSAPYVIPRLSGIENDFAVIGSDAQKRPLVPYETQFVSKMLPVFKCNAGIKVSTVESISEYSRAYLNAFEKSGEYFVWESHGMYAKIYAKTHTAIKTMYPRNYIWVSVLDIFNYARNPWTHALQGKRILIISPFVDTIKEQVSTGNVEKIYGGEQLFINNTFVYLKPPVTNCDEPAEEFKVEFDNFCRRVDEIKDDFDVALCSCGGYGNPICGYIYDIGKQAIYVGGVLQMYFGVLGKRWINDNPDIIKMYKNTYWTSPTEKPVGYEKVENGCYW